MISTNSKTLDEMLKGGVKRGLLYCIFGPAGSGKTQLCMQLTVNALRCYGSSSVLVIDAKGEFKVERVIEILNSQSYHNLTDRIYISRAYNTSDLFNAIDHIDVNRSLVIVEDAPLLFRVEYGNSIEGKFMLMRFMHRLAVNAVLMNTTIMVTNGVTSVMDESSKVSQIMDRAVSIFAHYKLMLERLNSSNGYTIVKATLLYPILGNREALFKIGKEGIVDY